MKCAAVVCKEFDRWRSVAFLLINHRSSRNDPFKAGPKNIPSKIIARVYSFFFDTRNENHLPQRILYQFPFYDSTIVKVYR